MAVAVQAFCSCRGKDLGRGHSWASETQAWVTAATASVNLLSPPAEVLDCAIPSWLHGPLTLTWFSSTVGDTCKLIQLSSELKVRGWPSLHLELMFYDNCILWGHLDTLCLRDLKSVLSVFGRLWHSHSRIGIEILHFRVEDLTTVKFILLFVMLCACI